MLVVTGGFGPHQRLGAGSVESEDAGCLGMGERCLGREAGWLRVRNCFLGQSCKATPSVLSNCPETANPLGQEPVHKASSPKLGSAGNTGSVGPCLVIVGHVYKGI